MTNEPVADHAAAPRFWQLLTDDDPVAGDLAEDFHEASKFYRSTIGRAVRGDLLQADPELARSASLGARELIHLPSVPLPRIDPAAEARTAGPFIRQPSGRRFAPRPLPLDTLGRLLWLSYGAYPEAHGDGGGRRRPVASGGALYPLEIYLLADLGTGERGVYHYSVHRHALAEVRASVPTEQVRRLGEPPEHLLTAPVTVLISSMFWRSRFKYRLRGYRFALLEAGAFIQQLTLVAQHLGLAVLPFAGLFDDVVEEICELDGVDESFVNAVVLGYPG